MNWRVTALVVFSAVLIGCGESEQKGLPDPVDPGAPTNPSTPTPPDTTPDPRLPDLTGSVPLDLLDPVRYSGIEEMTGQLVLGDLVGDSRLKLELTGDNATGFQGLLRFAFEHKPGLWWTDLRAFAGTTVINPTTFDAIFQDDFVVMRITADRAGDTLSNGKYFYRLHRQEELQCRRGLFYCGSRLCSEQELAQACRNYMAPSNTAVKVLATFEGKLSDWVKTR